MTRFTEAATVLLTDIGRGHIRHDAVRFDGHPPHRHDYPQLIYLVVGRALLTVDGDGIPLNEGDGVWIPTGMEHALDLEPGSVVMGPTLSTNGEPATGRPRRITEPTLRRLMATLLGVAPRNQHERQVFRTEIERTLHALADQYFPLRTPTHPAAAAIAREAANSTDTLADLARRQYLSARQAQRLFLQQTGTTFTTWRTQARLNLAISKLRGGSGIDAALTASRFTTREGLLKALSRECAIPMDQLLSDVVNALAQNPKAT